MSDNQDVDGLIIQEVAVLQKFDGEPLPENEVERMHIVDGKVVKIEKIENGEVVSTETR